eukprot:3941928-Rhodomonas_salina.7
MPVLKWGYGAIPGLLPVHGHSRADRELSRRVHRYHSQRVCLPVRSVMSPVLDPLLHPQPSALSPNPQLYQAFAERLLSCNPKDTDTLPQATHTQTGTVQGQHQGNYTWWAKTKPSVSSSPLASPQVNPRSPSTLARAHTHVLSDARCSKWRRVCDVAHTATTAVCCATMAVWYRFGAENGGVLCGGRAGAAEEGRDEREGVGQLPLRSGARPRRGQELPRCTRRQRVVTASVDR